MLSNVWKKIKTLLCFPFVCIGIFFKYYRPHGLSILLNKIEYKWKYRNLKVIKIMSNQSAIPYHGRIIADDYSGWGIEPSKGGKYHFKINYPELLINPKSLVIKKLVALFNDYELEVKSLTLNSEDGPVTYRIFN